MEIIFDMLPSVVELEWKIDFFDVSNMQNKNIPNILWTEFELIETL